jgi:hypothetical protein
MARHFHGPVTLTIPAAGTESGEIKGRDGELLVAQADEIFIHAPDTLPETVDVHVAPSEAPAAADYVKRGGPVPANSELVVKGGGAKALKLVSGLTAAERVFKVMFVYDSVSVAGV